MNNIKKAFAYLGKSIKQIWFDFIESFKIKPWKICTILFMIPGLFIGFFLGEHYTASLQLTESYGEVGVLLFGLTLLGCINIFNAFSFSAKRSKFMAVFASVVTLLLTVCSVLYISTYFRAAAANDYVFNTDSYISIGVVSVSTLCGIVASILSFFFINKEKSLD